jgi:hypothetical protein
MRILTSYSDRLFVALALTLALLLLAACAPAAPSSSSAASIPPTSTPPEPSPTAVPTATQPVTQPAIATPGAQWNYAVLGDSSSWGFPKFYAKYIEADLGVHLTMLNWTRGGLTSAAVLDELRSNQQERLDVSRSQVVSFYGNPLHITSLSIITGEYSDKYNCSPQAVARFKSEMSSIADEILLLRKGQPTIIRTYTRFMPSYRQWRAGGMFEEYSRCVAALDAATLELGKERGILVADTGLALNGPNHDQDPNDMGYLYDGMHENDIGARIVADVFRKLGYGYVVP